MSFALPQPARRFLRTTDRPHVHGIVHAFHRWLDRRELTLAELTPVLLQQFLARPRRVRVCRRVRVANKALLRPYLQWLYDHALVSFVPEPSRPRLPELPKLAREFLACGPRYPYRAQHSTGAQREAPVKLHDRH